MLRHVVGQRLQPRVAHSFNFKIAQNSLFVFPDTKRDISRAHEADCFHPAEVVIRYHESKQLYWKCSRIESELSSK